MPLFVAVHKWKPEEEIAVTKEVAGAFAAFPSGKIPEGIELCATYMTGAQGGYCVWVAPSKEALEKLFEQYMPTLKRGTEFVPVTQMYPPTMEYVLALWQQMIQAAPK